MLKLRGSGGMPSQEKFDQKTEFGDISATKAPLNVGQNMCILSTYYSYTLHIAMYVYNITS